MRGAVGNQSSGLCHLTHEAMVDAAGFGIVRGALKAEIFNRRYHSGRKALIPDNGELHIVDSHRDGPNFAAALDCLLNERRIPLCRPAFPAGAALRKLVALLNPAVPTLIAFANWYIVPNHLAQCTTTGILQALA